MKKQKTKQKQKQKKQRGLSKNMIAMIARSMFLSASPSYMNMQSLISIPFI
jgi:hypothetical protein